MENFLVAQLGVPLADIVFDSKFDGDCKVLFGNVHFYGDVQLEKDGKYQPPVPFKVIASLATKMTLTGHLKLKPDHKSARSSV